MEVKEEFAEGLTTNNGNEDWSCLKLKLLNVASEVCGYTKCKPRHFETWWLNKDVDMAVCRKRELFRVWKQIRMRKIGRNIVRQEKLLRE